MEHLLQLAPGRVAAIHLEVGPPEGSATLRQISTLVCRDAKQLLDEPFPVGAWQDR